MHQIEIQIVGAQAREAGGAGARDTIACDFITLHLRDQENAVALTGQHVTEELLGATATVISRGIEQGHAECNASAQRLFLHRGRMSALTEMPAALTERRDHRAVRKLYGPRGRLRYHASIGRLSA